MALDSYAPSLLDKLLGAGARQQGGTTLRHSVEQVKDSVARDIEMLLNAHQHFSPEELSGWPNAARSFLTLGLLDISPLSMASDKDRRRISEAIRLGLMAHDRRLANVQVGLRQVEGSVATPTFTIRAQLQLTAHTEPVVFDAVLQPGSKRYDVARADGRPAARLG